MPGAPALEKAIRIRKPLTEKKAELSHGFWLRSSSLKFLL